MYCSVFRLEEGRAVETQLKTEKILLIVRLKCNECIAADVRSGRSSARIAGSAQVAEYDFAVEKGSSYGSDPSGGRAYHRTQECGRACGCLCGRGAGLQGARAGDASVTRGARRGPTRAADAAVAWRRRRGRSPPPSPTSSRHDVTRRARIR